jgi:hypothetical protein
LNAKIQAAADVRPFLDGLRVAAAAMKIGDAVNLAVARGSC